MDRKCYISFLWVMLGQESKTALYGTISNTTLNIKRLKYSVFFFFLNWLTERASLVYSYIFMTFKFCALNECLTCLSLTVSVLYGRYRESWPACGSVRRRHTSVMRRDSACETFLFFSDAGGEAISWEWGTQTLGEGEDWAWLMREQEREKVQDKWRIVTQHWALCPQLDTTICSDAICPVGYTSPAAWQVL